GYVRLQADGRGHGVGHGPRFCDHLDMAGPVEQRAKPQAHDLVVIHEQEPDGLGLRFGHGLLLGMSTRMRVPSPRLEVTSSRPPSCWARDAMLRNPWPTGLPVPLSNPTPSSTISNR